MKKHNFYERAFEDLLRKRQIPYVAVDEAKRAAFRDAHLKSFDFIVYSTQARNWLIDIKGRRWARRPGQSRPSWQNWITQADLEGLQQWEEVFGDDFGALLVFAYQIEATAQPPPEIRHDFGGARYVFAGLPLAEYAPLARVRSPKWGTINIPTADFARLVRPLADWL